MFQIELQLSPEKVLAAIEAIVVEELARRDIRLSLRHGGKWSFHAAIIEKLTEPPGSTPTLTVPREPARIYLQSPRCNDSFLVAVCIAESVGATGDVGDLAADREARR